MPYGKLLYLIRWRAKTTLLRVSSFIPRTERSTCRRLSKTSPGSHNSCLYTSSYIIVTGSIDWMRSMLCTCVVGSNKLSRFFLNAGSKLWPVIPSMPFNSGKDKLLGFGCFATLEPRGEREFEGAVKLVLFSEIFFPFCWNESSSNLLRVLRVPPGDSRYWVPPGDSRWRYCVPPGDSCVWERGYLAQSLVSLPNLKKSQKISYHSHRNFLQPQTSKNLFANGRVSVRIFYKK